MVTFVVKAVSGFSEQARKTNAGPNVINVYRSEGGYLVTFKKDRKLKMGCFCKDHWAASPKKLPDLKIIKSRIKPVPDKKRILLLFAES